MMMSMSNVRDQIYDLTAYAHLRAAYAHLRAAYSTLGLGLRKYLVVLS
jgi:hypothetical protein